MELFLKIGRYVLCVLLVVGSILLTAALVLNVAVGSGSADNTAQDSGDEVAIMDRYDMYANNRISEALDGIIMVEKIYWLSDDDLIAPEPDQNKFGTDDPANLGWLLEDAQGLLGGQETYFSTETRVAPGTKAMYYLDETIFAVTWKTGIEGSMFTISEVKIAHPSQLRRFLAGGEYGSGIQMQTTQMAKTVNAVVASSGDFYNFGNRRMGIVVYDGEVKRVNANNADTCFINSDGDMLFSYRGELADKETAQKFVDDNNIRFSMAFGPVLIEDGKLVHTSKYLYGEINENYARAALCQKDELHYLVVVVNNEAPYTSSKKLMDFGRIIEAMGVEKAYTLDGGQTAVVVMNDKLINRPVFGSQRNISDIVYFATAIPDGE